MARVCVCVCLCVCVCVVCCVCVRVCMSAPFSGFTCYSKSRQLALHSSGGLLDYMHPPLCHAIGAEKSM